MEMDKFPHYHCPNDCEKPQPREYIEISTGRRVMICGKDLFDNNEFVEMFLCTPETCVGD